MAQIDPQQPISNVKTMDERFRARAAAPRLLMPVLSVFSAVPPLLATNCG